MRSTWSCGRYLTLSTSSALTAAARVRVIESPDSHVSVAEKCDAYPLMGWRKRSLLRNGKKGALRVEPSSPRVSPRALLPLPLLPTTATSPGLKSTVPLNHCSVRGAPAFLTKEMLLMYF